MAKRKKQDKRAATTSSYLVSVRITTKNKGGVAPATQKEVADAFDKAIDGKFQDRVEDQLFTGITLHSMTVGVGGESDAGEE